MSLKLAVLIVLCSTIPAYAQKEFVYEVRASDCEKLPSSRRLSGFRVRGEQGIVTALHGVVSCKTIRAKSDYGEELSEVLKISKMDTDADVALLTSSELSRKSDAGLVFARSIKPLAGARVRVLGYPLQTAYHETELTVRKPAERPLIEEVPPGPIMDALRQRNSPGVKLNILSIQGPIVPGHSGAPVVDDRDRLVAIANGGLKGGTVSQSWAVPYGLVVWERTLPSSRLSQLADNVDVLFAFGPDEGSSVDAAGGSTAIVYTPSNFVNRASFNPAVPAVLVEDGKGSAHELTTHLAEALVGSDALFTPAFLESKRFSRAHAGDPTALSDLGLSAAASVIVLGTRQVKLSPQDVSGAQFIKADAVLHVRVYRPSDDFRSTSFIERATGVGFTEAVAEQSADENLVKRVKLRLATR
jgi:hypothetical protein